MKYAPFFFVFLLIGTNLQVQSQINHKGYRVYLTRNLGQPLQVTDRGGNTYTVNQPCPSGFRLGVEENESTNLQLSPNPTANQTTISFNLAEADDVSLKIYNETGQEVAFSVDFYDKSKEKFTEF